ncbi:T-cell activation inhibitor, mitochondrial [Culicoides brevitarsis]|uniref:T-cell activation inhibitor, mitochondrial n=1 Tax=Culicoides brevitarsis TaxID=469753 RepID=UPI00307BD111
MLNYARNYVWGTNQLCCLRNGIVTRFITTQEVATALRPFYFVVHPDLFGKFPEQRSTNEDSLQRLSAHLEALTKHRLLDTTPKTLPFYVRAQNTENTLVNVPLERTLDTKKVIKGILEACKLATDQVDKLQTDFESIYYAQEAQRSKKSRKNTSGFEKYDEFYGTGDEFQFFWYQASKKREETTLLPWIRKNRIEAIKRSDAKMLLTVEVNKLRDELSDRLKLKNLIYDCGWNLEHFRGCLKALERLHELHSSEMHNLTGRTVVFASFTGVSLEGNVMLFTGDVPTNWLELIKNLPKHDMYLMKIPAYEYALSQVLLKIRVARRKFMPKAQANAYTSHLRKVTTSLLDYLSMRKYPKTWPETLEDYELVVESEAGPLMISPTGQIVVPATHPGSLLVDFITNHLDEAKQKQLVYQSNKHLERDLEEKCIQNMRLLSLTKDDSVTPDKMIECLTRLLELDPDNVNLTNVHLHITNYFSVLADGTVCIPFDFKM